MKAHFNEIDYADMGCDPDEDNDPALVEQVRLSNERVYRLSLEHDEEVAALGYCGQQCVRHRPTDEPDF